MAINHMVWIKFNPLVPLERQNHHLEALRALRHGIPEIVNLTIGLNFTDRAHGFTHGLVVQFGNRRALAAYAVHPSHVEVAAALALDALIWVLDYEY